MLFHFFYVVAYLTARGGKAKSGETKQQLRKSQESLPQQVYIHTKFP